MSTHAAILFTTMCICLATSLITWLRHHDALNPGVLIPFLLMGGYCWLPYQMVIDEDLAKYLTAEQLHVALLINAIGVLAICLGMMAHRKLPQNAGHWIPLPKASQYPALSRRLTQLAVALGAYAHLGFWSGIANSGGLVNTYSRVKGQGVVSSGYLGEASLMAYPAVLVYAIACRGRKLRIRDFLMALSLALPNLLHGTLGGRRGPIFLSLAVLFTAYVISRDHRPSLRIALPSLAICCVAVLLVMSQRQHMYIGSDEGFDPDSFRAALHGERLDPGSTPLVAAGQINVVLDTKKSYWGRRYAVTFLVRPIPKQWLPSKQHLYEITSDIHSELDWRQTVGWVPSAGTAIGIIADLFLEFRWGAFAAAFVFGTFLAWIWRQARIHGGIWAVLLAETLILSVYLPTQSFSAFMQRFLFMSVGTAVSWRFLIRPVWIQHAPATITPPDPPAGPWLPPLPSERMDTDRNACT